MIFLSSIEKVTHGINLGHFGLTWKSCGYNLEKKNWEPKSQINLMLKDKIDKKKVNLSQPTKLSMQVMYAIRFHNFFIS
jgi:hypothetical protein